jgi:hypothetical protein
MMKRLMTVVLLLAALSFACSHGIRQTAFTGIATIGGTRLEQTHRHGIFDSAASPPPSLARKLAWAYSLYCPA